MNIRLKRIQLMHIIKTSKPVRVYLNALQSLQSQQNNEGKLVTGGIYGRAKQERKYLLAGQFASTFLFPKLRETTLGEFMNSHPEIIKIAFCTSHFEYEPYLKWQEEQVRGDDINPDLMIQRSDGYFDIYDLKTPLLDREKITKGERRRRRFIDYVEEGIAQLAYYDYYFTFEKNREYAFNKYGIQVNQPRLILIVGNSENIEKEHIIEACRRYNRKVEDFEIIDYDTILQLYLNSTCDTELP